MVISFCAHRRWWGVVDGTAWVLLRRGGTGQWSGSGRPWDVVYSGVVIVEDFEVVSWHHSYLASQFTQPPVHLTVIVLLHHGNNIALSEGDFVRRFRHVVVARSREQRCTLKEKREEANICTACIHLESLAMQHFEHSNALASFPGRFFQWAWKQG